MATRAPYTMYGETLARLTEQSVAEDPFVAVTTYLTQLLCKPIVPVGTHHCEDADSTNATSSQIAAFIAHATSLAVHSSAARTAVSLVVW